MEQSYLKRMLVTHREEQSLESYLSFILGCVDAGVTVVQLREKKRSGEDLLAYAKALHATLKPKKIPLIINDTLDLCLSIGADGLHLGQGDGDVVTARKALGNRKILGLSVSNQNEIIEANTLPVDYIGVGPIFHSCHKQADRLWGLDGLRKAITLSRHPVVAIGGIHSNALEDVVSTGVAGVAAIDMFHKPIGGMLND